MQHDGPHGEGSVKWNTTRDDWNMTSITWEGTLITEKWGNIVAHPKTLPAKLISVPQSPPRSSAYQPVPNDTEFSHTWRTTYRGWHLQNIQVDWATAAETWIKVAEEPMKDDTSVASSVAGDTAWMDLPNSDNTSVKSTSDDP